MSTPASDFTPLPVLTFRFDIGADPDFTKKGYGHKLKALGGSFSECRGWLNGSRYLHIPNTPEGHRFAAYAGSRFGNGSGAEKNCFTLVMGCPHGSYSAIRAADHVFYIREDHIVEDIEAAFARYDRQERAWWEREGRDAARREAERLAQDRARALASVPDKVAECVKRAAVLGASEHVIRGAFEVALLSIFDTAPDSAARKTSIAVIEKLVRDEPALAPLTGTQETA
jgi:hypothetical protein